MAKGQDEKPKARGRQGVTGAGPGRFKDPFEDAPAKVGAVAILLSPTSAMDLADPSSPQAMAIAPGQSTISTAPAQASQDTGSATSANPVLSALKGLLSVAEAALAEQALKKPRPHREEDFYKGDPYGVDPFMTDRGAALDSASIGTPAAPPSSPNQASSTQGSQPLFMILCSAEWSHLHSALTAATAALLLRRPTTMLFSGAAIIALSPPLRAEMYGENERHARACRVATLAELLSQVQALGGRLQACEAALQLASINHEKPSALSGAAITGMVSFMAEAATGQLLCF
ncbi:hypothetical protein E3E12_08420 [Formicincola oecophyllae]|uniref:Uncharacterized protein n=1 Tax=Formicincola oecophyllae TaxID=2558361 RepID=A0A4Y6UCK7_9PROT|nr:hypothetical protein [Formicincola oecophyllae]QDH14206.1 hypothetical protein E3E12_08420 [Formicincola oecophyllae]